MKALGDYQEALDALFQSLAMRTASLGDVHLLVANTHIQIAEVYLLQKDSAKAEERLKVVLEVGKELGWKVSDYQLADDDL